MGIAEVLVIGDEGVLTGHLGHGGEIGGNGPVLLYLHLLIDFLYNKLHEHILNLCLRLIGNLICISMLIGIQWTECAIELRVLVISVHVVGGGHIPFSMGHPRRALEVFGGWLCLGFIMGLWIYLEDFSWSVLLKFMEGGRILAIGISWLLALIWLLRLAGVLWLVLVGVGVVLLSLGTLLLEVEWALDCLWHFVELVHVHYFNIIGKLWLLVNIGWPGSLVHNHAGRARVVWVVALEVLAEGAGVLVELLLIKICLVCLLMRLLWILCPGQ